ncbi:hypothetical protein [Herbaspirillum huttiense]|jgi:hypothetical protein|uniref:Uncharacterized protein n=2 Tax=Herbaspirillum huttiense TaxID=863372 RepID=A0AAJ2HDZ4_9BURK|nr:MULTISPECIES: hypothetical protein [Herbaspirillum]MDR9837868.1 hypothetical protein [Herbaspirillum huttiense]
MITSEKSITFLRDKAATAQGEALKMKPGPETKNGLQQQTVVCDIRLRCRSGKAVSASA